MRLASGLALALAGSASAVTITVTNINDSGPGSLRQALFDIATSAAPRVVAFNLPPAGAVHTIAINSPLVLAGDTLLDGTTQPLFSNPPPVRVTAAPGFVGTAGLWAWVATNSIVRGLQVSGFTNSTGIQISQPGCAVEQCWVVSNAYGISISDVAQTRIGGPAASNRNHIGRNTYGVHIQGVGASGNLVAGNYIGVLPASGGVVPATNVIGVLLVAGASSNIIRGSGGAPQVISGNSSSGIDVEPGCPGNRIEGNLIGVDPTGFLPVPNYIGVYLLGSNAVLGGLAASNRNVISGNTQYGVYLGAGANGHRVAGNYIGVNVMGSPAVGGQAVGVHGFYAFSNEISGGAAAAQVIAGHTSYGIQLISDTGSVIRGNLIGLGSTGAAVSNQTGVALSSCADTLIGGTNAADRNLVGGNSVNGIQIDYSRGVRVEGNLIGMDSSGLPRPTGTGINVVDSRDVVIGGATTNARNYIGGTTVGIAIGNAGASNVQVRGNHIGLTPAGALLTNSSYGISVAAPYCTIGGSNSVAERNVIAGNWAGLFLTGLNAHHNVVVGNFIGTDPAGSSARSNYVYGLWIFGGSSNRVGGLTAAERNVISGNAGYGLFISGAGATGNEVLGNFIGTTASGLSRLGNGLATNYTSGAGVVLTTPGNRVAGNVISGNRYGLEIRQAEARQNRVEGNYIGVSASGLTPLGNLATGVRLSVFASSNTIGGTAAGAGNVISANEETGLELSGVSNNAVQGNFIGPGADGLAAFTNQDDGIVVAAAADNLIGGPTSAARNLISGHPGYGLQLITFSSGTRVEGNWIGLDGTGADALSNRLAGVLMSNSSGSNVLRGNVVSGNGEGIALTSTNSPGDWITGNWIGTDASGLLPVGNRGNGIFIADGIGLRVGGTGPGEGNTIAFNGSNGVAVTWTIAGQGVRNPLLGNLIYSNTALAIDLNGNGPTTNDPAPDADTGANGLQNFPRLTNAVQGLTLVQGFLVSAPSQTYLLEFYAAPSGGQARVFLGRTNFVMGGAGTGTFTYVLSGTAPTGWVVAATATDPSNHTSELTPFSASTRIRGAVDGDGDGLWDIWEQANFGGSLTNSGAGDNDGDGVNNYAEFVADTSPTNAASLFEITAFSNAPPRQSGWPSSAARHYDVDYSPTLLPAAWLGLASNLPGTGGLMTLPDPSADTTRVYRVRAKVP